MSLLRQHYTSGETLTVKGSRRMTQTRAGPSSRFVCSQLLPLISSSDLSLAASYHHSYLYVSLQPLNHERPVPRIGSGKKRRIDITLHDSYVAAAHSVPVRPFSRHNSATETAVEGVGHTGSFREEVWRTIVDGRCAPLAMREEIHHGLIDANMRCLGIVFTWRY